MNPKYHQFLNHYHAHKDNLFTYLMYRLNFDRTLAEDLMMDIFLKAYEHFDQFSSEKGSFKIWLFALAYHYLESHPHKEGKAISSKKIKEECADEIGKEDYKMSEQIDNEKVQRMFTLLEEANREIISLRYVQGLTNKEISHVTGKKEEMIQTHLSKALKQLSDFYKKTYSKP